MLLEEETSEDSFEVDDMSRQWYNACMNETRIEELGVQPVLDSLKALGGWPVLEEDDKDYASFKWYEQTQKLNREGFSMNAIMTHTIGSDDRNNSYRVFKLDQASLGMQREYLIKGFEDKLVQHYYQYMVDSAILLGADEARAKTELKESLLFEIALANISAPREERRDDTKLYHPTTLGQLDSSKNETQNAGEPSSWVEYIAGTVRDGVAYKEGHHSDKADTIKIGSDEKVIIRNPAFFKNVSKLITKTNPKVVANYMAWRVVASTMDVLNKDAREIQQKYAKALTGVAKIKATWKRCVASAGFNSISFMSGGGAASSMYVRKYFKPEDKKVMLNMVAYVRKYFTKMLDKLTWMDDATKLKAKKKMEEMDQFIAYPDELVDQTMIDGLHKGLSIYDFRFNSK